MRGGEKFSNCQLIQFNHFVYINISYFYSHTDKKLCKKDVTQNTYKLLQILSIYF